MKREEERKVLVVREDAYYTIKELTDGFVVSRSSIYEMMQNKGLKYSRFGGKRLILGKELKAYLEDGANREIEGGYENGY